MLTFPSRQTPVAASIIERCILFGTALYVYTSLIRTFLTSEIGKFESLNLIILSIWTWCTYSFGFPASNKDEKISHKVWGTDEKCYRNDVDDGAFYGALLIPIVAAVKMIETHNTKSFNDDYSHIEFLQVNYEFCIIMGSSIVIHMFLSKHLVYNDLGSIWCFLITTGLSTLHATIIKFIGLLPKLTLLPWQSVILSLIIFHTVLYSITKFLKRCFTFGEMAIVAQAITLLIIELFIVTINKFDLIGLPPFKNHIPSEITIFQLALILGMFLIGFILSSLLLHSRYLAQIPKWRKRCVEKIENKKKQIASIIYCGTLIMVFLIGKWLQLFLLEDPFTWIIYFIMESNNRIFLCTYWLTAIIISLILFLQLFNSRKTFSLNTKRKYFHGLAMIMFIPGYLYEPKFMHLAFSVAFAALIFLEYLRYFAVYPFGKQLHLFLNEFLDHRDSGPMIMSHLYLLIGCAGCIWLKGNSILANLSGVLTLGLGDSMASVIGKKYGRYKWPGTSKTVEGFIAFIIFQSLGVFILSKLWMADNMWPRNENWITYTIKVSLTALLEAVSYQNDNLTIPLYLWSLVSLSS